MPRNDVPNWPGPAPLPPMTATCRYCIALASLSSLVWGRTPVLRPVLQNGPRRPEERVLEDPRRPGGLPHKLCSIPNLGKTTWHHKSPLPSKVEADHFSQIPQDQLAVRQRHRGPDFLPGVNLRSGDLVIRRGAGLDQPWFADVAIQRQEHAVGQHEAAQTERGLPLAGPDLLALEIQASEQAPLLLAHREQMALVHDRRVHL